MLALAAVRMRVTAQPIFQGYSHPYMCRKDSRIRSLLIVVTYPTACSFLHFLQGDVITRLG